MKNNQIIWLLIFICAGIFLVWRMSNSEAGRIWHYPVAHEFADTGTKVNWEPIKRIDDDGRHSDKQGPAVTEYVISRRADATADWTEVETADVHLKDGHLVYPSQFIDKDAGVDQEYQVIAKSGDQSEQVPIFSQQVHESVPVAPDTLNTVYEGTGVGWTTWNVVKSRDEETELFGSALSAAGHDKELAQDPSKAIETIKANSTLSDTAKEALLANARQVESISLNMSGTIGLWLSAFFTLCIMSFLYRDNPLYKFAEAVVIGTSAAYVMAVGFWTMIVKNLFSNLVPRDMKESLLPGMPITDVWTGLDWSYIVPAVFIVLLLWRLMPAGGWVSRWPLAFFIGITAGLRLIAFLEADFMAQIAATMIPLWVTVHDAAGGLILWDSLWASFTNIVIVVATLTGLVYFFFSVEHKGAVGGAAKIGIWFLMITFGASFGYTVMGRIALLAERLQYLFGNWLHLTPPT